MGGCIGALSSFLYSFSVSSLYGRVYRCNRENTGRRESFLPVWEGVSAWRSPWTLQKQFPPYTGGCIAILFHPADGSQVSSLYGRVYRIHENKDRATGCFLPVREGVSLFLDAHTGITRFPPYTGGCIVFDLKPGQEYFVSSLYGRVYYPQEDMMFGLKNIFEKTAEKELLTREEIADFIKTDPEALRAFEESYSKHVINKDSLSDNFFAINAKQMANEKKKYLISDIVADSSYLDAIIQRIVAELLDSAAVYVWDGKEDHFETFDSLPENYVPVSNDEIRKIPESQRPELTGFRYKRDISENDAGMILWAYREYLKCKNSAKKRKLYGVFRQGLDIQDLDPITYKIIDRNITSMGYWLPPLIGSVKKQDFFKVPATKVLKVPLPLLQLTRMEYMALTLTTMRIVDEFCYKAFDLKPSREYFIKTGTYSSKFDFRNAHVVGEKEVQELGEYLLFIHYQALCMAHYDLSGRNQPIIYGVSTTTEWVVREYIQPDPDTKEIYYGLPLRPEYRIFVDFDSDEIIGCSPYWEPKTMKKRFGHCEDSDDPDKVHDYIIYSAAEEELMEQYHKNIGNIAENLQKMIPEINLTGQWSMDIMQNKNDFYIIDMAPAATSALNECVPAGKLKDLEEDWIPRIGK